MMRTVEFPPHNYTIPNVTNADAATIVAADLVQALTTLAPTTLFAPPEG